MSRNARLSLTPEQIQAYLTADGWAKVDYSAFAEWWEKGDVVVRLPLRTDYLDYHALVAELLLQLARMEIPDIIDRIAQEMVAPPVMPQG